MFVEADDQSGLFTSLLSDVCSLVTGRVHEVHYIRMQRTVQTTPQTTYTADGIYEQSNKQRQHEWTVFRLHRQRCDVTM
jgi:hypothetical protein